MAKKKKAAKKKAVKKPKPKKKDKDEEEPKRRQSMSEVVQRHKSLIPAVLTPDQFDFFNFPRLFTGIIDIDLLLRPTIGKRICLIGKPQMGKSLTAHIFTGAAHRTCRFCFKPIIDWMNEETGEIIPKCKCGKNARMIVIHVDVEDSFDPWWASKWGVHLEDREYEMHGYKYKKTRGDDLYVVMPLDGDMAFDFTGDAVENGAVDFVIFDSIAMMLPSEDMIDKEGQRKGVSQDRIGSRARLVGKGLMRILNAQIKARLAFQAKPTVVWTNQYYQGPTRSVWESPNKPAGGLRARHAADHNMAFISTIKIGEKAVRSKMGVRALEILFEAEKSKSAGTGGAQGKFTVYLDDYKTQYGMLTAGDTDEANRLYAYLHDLGLYKNTGTKKKPVHECLGRTFKRVTDLVSFLYRDDIRYISRYFIFRELLPVSALAYLEEADYDYSPFGRDKAFELFGEKQKTETTDQIDPSGESGGDREKGEEEDWIPMQRSEGDQPEE